ncbi:MBL fold metallo-hydrolase [Xylanibacillus composti]|uniref:Putative polyketide biosynthesis zinc-dependent hydrolase PksB n=1 Tax=Xylanibacillus composti TaxID=1572762 RepID=A0A8J4H668_9BACL|nr:MBL fold metallo-hydrolase [Xylanibacillus composti]MDT9727004.1 MBL fold metallo-hydrolase [Xylanibacillus composti]GIQ69564.1 putative polyketide biosynthesis zinc-dependent hydrolase PksB [Xylanibacillus composti]
MHTDLCEVITINTRSLDFSNYCYLIADEQRKEAFVVDPAWEAEKIIHEAEKRDCTLSGILLTHAHNDHVNAVHPLAERYKLPVYMSQTEIDRYGFRVQGLEKLADLDQLQVGAINITCILTPGHTAGSMCYLTADSAFTGDTLFAEGCGACDSDGSSADQLFDSLQRLRKLIPPEARLYPGHSFSAFPGQRMEQVLKENLYLAIRKKEEFIQFRMRKNQGSFFNFR